MRAMLEMTTLPARELDRLALALRAARERRDPIAPLTEALPDLSVADAYAIAQRNVAARVAAGATIVGHKIGLTSPAVQAQLGVDQPDYGALLDVMAIADRSTVDAGAFIAPRIELELAFELAEALPSAGVTADDVRRATARVLPALELVDSRIRDWRIRLADTVADAASSAAFVLGVEGRPLSELDAADVAGELWRGDRASGVGQHERGARRPVRERRLARQRLSARSASISTPARSSCPARARGWSTSAPVTGSVGCSPESARSRCSSQVPPDEPDPRGRDRRLREHRHRPDGEAAPLGVGAAAVDGRDRPGERRARAGPARRASRRAPTESDGCSIATPGPTSSSRQPRRRSTPPTRRPTPRRGSPRST